MLKNTLIALLISTSMLIPAYPVQVNASTEYETLLRQQTLTKIQILLDLIQSLQAKLATLQQSTKQSSVASTTAITKVAVAKKGTITGSEPEEFSSYLATSVDGLTKEYKGIPVLGFELTGKGDSFDLKSLSVNFTVAGTAKVTKAYLYQGDSVPLASADVLKKVATFNIPKGTAGASFGSDIPTKFTVKVDVSGLEQTTVTISRCYGIGYGAYDRINPYFADSGNVRDGQMPFTLTRPASFTSSIVASGVHMFDSQNTEASVKGTVTSNPIQLSAFKSLSNICYDSSAAKYLP